MSFQNRTSPSQSVSSQEWAKLSKTQSTSTAYSIASSSSRQTNTSIQESYAKQYFTELEKYLASMLSREAAEGVPPQRTTARQKLSRLNNLQFHELATDVYDEMMRRQLDSKSFLPLRDDFHPRRNQARQKLATLPTTRFQDLASDVYHELKRRYPHLVSEQDVPPMPSKSIDAQAHPSQSTHIVPVKGMMSVEAVHFNENQDTEVQDAQASGENLQSLDSLMADLGNMVKTPRPDMASTSETNTHVDTESIRYEYENKIASMAKRIKMLELSLETDPSNSSSASIKLRQMQEEYSQLDSKYNQLSQEHQEQQVAVREVKNEIKQLIEELKHLSSKNEALRAQNEASEAQIKSLTDEMRSWKRKYETISMELRSFKVRSVNMDHADFSQAFLLKPNPKGAIGHQFIIDYQTAIDELMKTSRSSKPTDVLVSMRTIVMACKSITSEVEEYEVNVGLSAENQELLYEIKKRFSNELTNLLAATKSYAGGMGISPVSLMDAAASNLTNTIVDLVKLLGMRPIEAHDGSTHHTTPSPSYNHAGIMNPRELSQFLKTETDRIVSSVQHLLSALRTSDGHLYNIITSIIDIVSNIVHVAKMSFSNGDGLRYKNQGNIILSDLDRCNSKIIRIRDSSFAHAPENANAAAKRNLAQESYEIAKYTKELINMLDM